jgi:membrane fusion protein, multidrug efflux system
MNKTVYGGAIFAIIACFILTSCTGKTQEAKGANTDRGQGIPVTVAAVEVKDAPIEIKTFGIVQAHSTVPIRAEVGGNLIRVHFRKGQNIRQGDLLFTIDPRSYKADLDQARATLERDKALEENARLNAERAKELVKKGYIAQSDDDKAQADARALSATIRADEAAVINARLQLEHCTIRSPIDGKAGDLLVNEGTLIKANDIPMVTINQIHPIEVFFSIPQADLPAVRTHMAQRKLKVRVSFPQDESPPEEGDLFFVDNTIDKGTGTVQLAGMFSNDRELLWPGQYVNVVLVLSVQKDALVVPAAAVQVGRDGKFVFVLKPDQTVEVRPVAAGMTTGSGVVIEQGLRIGERVVTDGQLRLTSGARVEIKNDRKAKGMTAGGHS